MLPICVTDVVVKLERLILSKEEHPLNMDIMSITDDVEKFERAFSSNCRFVHPENIELSDVAPFVLNEPRFAFESALKCALVMLEQP